MTIGNTCFILESIGILIGKTSTGQFQWQFTSLPPTQSCRTQGADFEAHNFAGVMTHRSCVRLAADLWHIP